jgi:multidrug efflux pump subunit AcrA (membrane-fusion protein)
LRGTIPNQDYEFLPGMFARVQIPIGALDNALLVLDRAPGIDQRGHYVLVVDQNDEVQQRPVEIGPGIDGMQVITKGLSVDDRVVVDGIQRAIPGNKVAPKQVVTPPPDSAAAPQPAAQ